MKHDEDYKNEFKVGDKVCICSARYRLTDECRDTANILKITQAGYISTDKGRYKKNAFGDFIGIGNAIGYIVPCTKQHEEKVIAYKNEKRLNKKIDNEIGKATRICYDIAYMHKMITYEQAKAITKALSEDE